jgi:hypothetical protein
MRNNRRLVFLATIPTFLIEHWFKSVCGAQTAAPGWCRPLHACHDVEPKGGGGSGSTGWQLAADSPKRLLTHVKRPQSSPTRLTANEIPITPTMVQTQSSCWKINSLQVPPPQQGRGRSKVFPSRSEEICTKYREHWPNHAPVNLTSKLQYIYGRANRNVPVTTDDGLLELFEFVEPKGGKSVCGRRYRKVLYHTHSVTGKSARISLMKRFPEEVADENNGWVIQEHRELAKEPGMFHCFRC